MKCEKCGVELEQGRSAFNQSIMYEHGVREMRDGVKMCVIHSVERCRDRLAARLAEVEGGTAAMASGYESQIAALRAELAECRAELEAASADILTVMAGEKAAEARAERLWKALEEGRLACEPFDDVKPRKWVTDYENLARFHQHACGALAETEKEKP